MEKILINDLSFAYPDEPNRLIIKDINLEIEQGEFVCLLGQSGCGKSTLLKLLAGLQKPSQGEITIDGNPIKGASLERTVVFQDYGLFPWMTAGENILLALQQKYPKQPKKELKNRAMEMLKQVGLDESVYKKLPKELSGGMKQRCAIARSLGVDAPILLMDEPFGALDAVTRAKLQDLILQLWSKEEVKKTVSGFVNSLRSSFVMLVYAEMYGASHGLGFYVKRYSTLGLYQKVWGGFIFMVLVLVVVMTFFEKIKNRMLKWTIN